MRDRSAVWVLRYTAPSGRRREMGLGVARRGSSKETGESLTAAREAAARARVQLQVGADPIEERRRQREADQTVEAAAKTEKKRQQLTLARAARDYHERVEPRLSTKHAAQWIARRENHVPSEVWNKPIAQIEAPELLAALSGVRSLEDQGARVPETLRRIRQRLDAVFEDAIFHKHCTSNPAAAIRRKMRETLPQGKPGQFRALGFRGAPAFMAKLHDAQGIAARCLEFALLTAARTTEALTAEWCEFNMEEGTWTIPAAKMKAAEEHVVHLSKRACELVTSQIGLDQKYLFPSAMKPGRTMSNMSLLATLDRLGMRSQTTVHGVCRATFSTWPYETAAARPDVIEACLAHKEADKVKAGYRRCAVRGDRARRGGRQHDTKGKVESGVKYVKRNFAPGRAFRDLEDFNTQLAQWQATVADERLHGTTHQRPIDRFKEEAKALVPTAGHPSFLAAMVRDRIVATDWLVSIEGNRYSVPFALIGKTVQVVRQGGSWVIRHHGQVVAEHAVLAGRAQLSVCPEHGPGAAVRNARQRYAGSRELASDPAQMLAAGREVEVRELTVYEQLLDAA